MTRKMYSVTIKAKYIQWRDIFQVYAKNKEEAEKLAIKEWTEEHKPEVKDISEYFEEII